MPAVMPGQSGIHALYGFDGGNCAGGVNSSGIIGMVGGRPIFRLDTEGAEEAEGAGGFLEGLRPQAEPYASRLNVLLLQMLYRVILKDNDHSHWFIGNINVSFA
jgi:hypothetical protein